MTGATKLTDAQWACIQPLLPAKAKTGRPRADDRTTLDAILWILRTGAVGLICHRTSATTRPRIAT